jgi:integrase
LVIFRLSCCCGLRASEICGLNVGDVEASGRYPYLYVRKLVAKGKRHGRKVPLWWDKGTLADIAAWQVQRGGADGEPFVTTTGGGRYNRRTVAKKWNTALLALGEARAAQLSIHSGRRSFCSHCLYAGIPLVAVRDAAGHLSIATTNRYLFLVDDDSERPDPFSWNGAPATRPVSVSPRLDSRDAVLSRH